MNLSLLFPLWLAVASEDAAVHPADGPDADVKIFVRSDAVTFQIIMNLAFADEVVDVFREQEEALHPAEYPALRAELVELYRTQNRVTIDGVEVAPVDAGFEVPEPDDSLLALFPRCGMRALLRMRLTLEYPAKSPPQRVTSTWGVFPPDRVLEEPGLETPPMVVGAELFARGIDERITFMVEEPTHTWQDTGESLEDRFEAVPDVEREDAGTVPALSLGLIAGWIVAALGLRLTGMWPKLGRVMWIGAPLAIIAAVTTTGLARVPGPKFLFSSSSLPTVAQAANIFEPLHANIYRAFDYPEESEAYDALARSVDGPLLDRLYNEIYTSLTLQQDGGAVCRIKRVTPLKTDVESLHDENGKTWFDVLAHWQVYGEVFHSGHAHSRTIEHRARYVVSATDAGWRITDSVTQEQVITDTDVLPDTGEPSAGSSDPVRDL